MPCIALYFGALEKYFCLIISEKCVVTPNFLFGFPCQDLLFSHSHKPHKNTSVLVGTVLN